MRRQRGDGDAKLNGACMAAKRKIAPPKPNMNLPWSELTKAQRNQIYTKALLLYGRGEGPNPGTSGQFARARTAAENDA
jgi:hypothetical protein